MSVTLYMLRKMINVDQYQLVIAEFRHDQLANFVTRDFNTKS